MNEQFYFWIVVGFVALLLVLFALRELSSMRYFPRGHEERGQSGFNALALFIAALFVLALGAYIDHGRFVLDSFVAPYPHARYAFEQNYLSNSASWVYETKDPPMYVVEFYRAYAKEKNIRILEDDIDTSRLSLILPSGNIFLTLKEHDGLTQLYYTREGQVRVVTGE